jgi:hypothetical protein
MHRGTVYNAQVSPIFCHGSPKQIILNLQLQDRGADSLELVSPCVIISRDFDGLFMILSYSLDVRHVPLRILFFNVMFSYLNFIIYDFFSLSCNPDLGTEFLPKNVRLYAKNGAFFIL